VLAGGERSWVTTTGRVPTNNANVLLAVAADASVTWTVKVFRPVMVGVPERRPEEFKLNPGGS
jgi:hypothetical protein